MHGSKNIKKYKNFIIFTNILCTNFIVFIVFNNPSRFLYALWSFSNSLKMINIDRSMSELCTSPDRPWNPPSLLYNGYRVFPGGKERPGRDADPSPPSSAVGHERVELYLYSLSWPYGLYRASVPVQG